MKTVIRIRIEGGCVWADVQFNNWLMIGGFLVEGDRVVPPQNVIIAEELIWEGLQRAILEEAAKSTNGGEPLPKSINEDGGQDR